MVARGVVEGRNNTLSYALKTNEAILGKQNWKENPLLLSLSSLLTLPNILNSDIITLKRHKQKQNDKVLHSATTLFFP